MFYCKGKEEEVKREVVVAFAVKSSFLESLEVTNWYK